MAKKKDEEKKSLSRREFLKDTGMVVGGAALTMGALSLAGCASPEAETTTVTGPGTTKTTTVTGPGTTVTTTKTETATPWLPSKWDYEADVVVVGYGGAGAATAITAHDAGAKVIILEKMPEGGGNTAVSGGGFVQVSNVDDAVTYIKALYQYTGSEMDENLIRTFAQEAVNNDNWIKSLRDGQQVITYGYAGYPELPGAESIEKHQAPWLDSPESGYNSLWGLLSYAVEEDRGIDILFETPAKRLVQDGITKEVLGVIAEANGREIAIKASRAVVLTTGGYENDASFIRNHVFGWPIHFLGNPGNTGDGIRMAQAVGAGLWHMNGLSCPLGIKVPEFEAAFMPTITARRSDYIYVDKFGKRFVNEKGIEAHAWITAVNFFDDEHICYPRIPCYMVFDEDFRVAGPLGAGPLGGVGYNTFKKYLWSNDNLKEIDAGWIIKSNSIEELAGKLGVDANTLVETVSRWNDNVQSGEDTEFGRPVEAPEEVRPPYIPEEEVYYWSHPIDTPPFYGVALWPAMLNSQGGPRRNTSAQILDVFGKPVPRLYSSGELGCMWGLIYQGAGNIGECLAFGRIAGENAAAETPWG